MLTGDKEETAVNIGFAAGLLDNDTPRVLVSSSKHIKLARQLQDASSASCDQKFAIILSGKAIAVLGRKQDALQSFLKLVEKCKTVRSSWQSETEQMMYQ
jgi:magnesium-transporting ATPase (P-type)